MLRSYRVLILVVMEDGLVLKKMWQRKQNAGLNPCCSGRCSSTVERPGFYHPGKHDVLILVVVEDVLVLARQYLFR